MAQVGAFGSICTTLPLNMMTSSARLTAENSIRHSKDYLECYVNCSGVETKLSKGMCAYGVVVNVSVMQLLQHVFVCSFQEMSGLYSPVSEDSTVPQFEAPSPSHRYDFINYLRHDCEKAACSTLLSLYFSPSPLSLLVFHIHLS